MTIRIHSAKMKAEVALLAIKNEKTVLEISQDYKIHPSLINKWKSEVIGGLSTIFEKDKAQKLYIQEREIHIEMIEKKLGQIVIENEYLKKNYARVQK